MCEDMNVHAGIQEIEIVKRERERMNGHCVSVVLDNVYFSGTGGCCSLK